MIASPQQLAERALKSTRSPDCIVIVNASNSANLRWANNTLTTNGVSEGCTVTVLAFDGDRVGSVTGPAATLDQVESLVQAADAALSSASASEDHNPLIEAVESPDWDESPGSTGIEVFSDFARSLGAAFGRAEAEHRILYGFVDHNVTTTYVASSSGLRLRHQQPTGHYACTGKTADLSASAWVGAATRDFVGVDAEVFDAELKTRLCWSNRQITLPAGRYDTVVPPGAVGDLMIEAYWNAGARVAIDGQSVYSRTGGGTRAGEQLVSKGVRLHSDPWAPGIECMPFVATARSSNDSSVFDNGLALAPTDWINDGVVRSLIQTRHSAQLTGLETTPAIDNLILDVDSGSGTVQDMVAGVERGLLLTCLWYIREVDPQSLLLTGLTRDGVYLIEGGEITAAVNNFRFNESPIDLLRRFTHASTSAPAFPREWGDEYFSRTVMPALRVPDFNMSSVSAAL